MLAACEGSKSRSVEPGWPVVTAWRPVIGQVT
jgi:hypothetical protein